MIGTLLERTMEGLSYMEKKNIEEKALEFMNKMGYVDDSDAVDVIDIAKKAGFAVGNAMLDDDEDYCFWFPCHLNFTDMRSCIGYKNFKYDEPDGHGFI